MGWGACTTVAQTVSLGSVTMLMENVRVLLDTKETCVNMLNLIMRYSKNII
jgi:hypothetical protein